MEGICYVFGAGNASGAVLKKRPCDFVIAADGGLTALEKLGVKPDMAVGDFDSLGREPDGYEYKKSPAEKDDTDMALAVNEGVLRGYEVFAMLGGTGGRLDHTLANISLLTKLSNSGAAAYLIGDGMVMTAVTNGKLIIPAGKSGYISVFCAGDEARGVSLRGLRYTLDNAVLTYTKALGVSNEFTGSGAEIEVKEGTLAVLWYEDNFDPADCGVVFMRDIRRN